MINYNKLYWINFTVQWIYTESLAYSKRKTGLHSYMFCTNENQLTVLTNKCTKVLNEHGF